jgi:hypothetical protein
MTGPGKARPTVLRWALSVLIPILLMIFLLRGCVA